MPYPIPSDQVNSPASGAVCDIFAAMMKLASQYKTNLSWMSNDATGDIAIEFAREIGALVIPSKTIVPFVPDTTQGDPAVAWTESETQVRQLWWTAAEISADTRASFWRICDGANGTPDLRDRFLKSSSGTVLPKQSAGSGAATLTYEQIPSHWHPLGYLATLLSPNDMLIANRAYTVSDFQGVGLQGIGISSRDGFLPAENYGVNARVGNLLGTLPDRDETLFTDDKEQESVSINPPHYTLVFMMRTSIMS